MRRGQRGTAMAEMLVATLLVALAVSMVMGALLNAPTQGKRTEINEKAHAATEVLLETLGNYNRDPAAQMSSDWPAPGAPAWHLPGDACVGLASDCWALQPCLTAAACHTVTDTQILPADFQAAPYNATMSYRVWTKTSNGEVMPQVETVVDWQLP